MSPSKPPERSSATVRRGGIVLRGSRPGDLRFRRIRTVAERIQLRELRPSPRTWPPSLVLALGFAATIAVGTLLLTLPLARADGQWTPALVALFTATSAVCVTGLVVVDTGTYWSPVGHVVILALFQVGGLGFMTVSTLLLLLAGRRASLRDRLLVGEAMGAGSVGTVLQLARSVVLFTLVLEGTGAILLTLRFLREYPPGQAVWWGLFHSVSAFNNSGFDLMGGFQSFAAYSSDAAMLGIMAALVVCGSLGYAVLADVWRRRRWVRLSLDSKLVLLTSAILLVGGTLLLLFLERNNPDTLGPMSPPQQLLNAGFHAVVPRSAGFSSINVGAMTEEGLVTTIALMFIGGAPGSTAGGIKVTTFSVLFFAIISAMRGSDRVEAFNNEVPLTLVLRAISIALLAIALVYFLTLILSISERHGFIALLFEATSASGIVGLSTGITPSFSSVGQLLLIAAMYAGRLGPLTLALALASRRQPRRYNWAEAPVRIG